MNTLNDIALKTGTDKSSLIHDYCRKFEKWLPFDRQAPLTMLEIGVFKGESLAMWREYYPNAKIIGLDCNPDCLQYRDVERNVHVEIGYQSDRAFLASLAEKHGPFDLIVDDGSHIQDDVITSFLHLWPSVKSTGGVYVVEDICTSYWESHQGGFKQSGTMVEFFKGLVDDVNFFGAKLNTHPEYARRDDLLIHHLEGQPCYGKTIEALSFLNSIVLVTKR